MSRGDGVTIRSVIWFSDIRGFTRLSSLLDRDIVISLINDVFETTELVLRERGGEVLKFMGDGLMGVFPVQDNGDEERNNSICRIAREAAHEFQSRLGELRERRIREGLPVVDVGVGLHYGDVSACSCCSAKSSGTCLSPLFIALLILPLHLNHAGLIWQ